MPHKEYHYVSSLGELAKEIGVSLSRLRMLRANRGIKKSKNGYCIETTAELIVPTSEEDVKKQPSAEQLRYYRARLAELALEEKRGNLVTVESVVACHREIANIVTGGLHTLGPRLAPKLAGQSNEGRIIEIIDNECRTIIEEMVNRMSELGLTKP